MNTIILYLRLVLLDIFMDMARDYSKEETDAVLHLEVCEYHNPSTCEGCKDIYLYFKKKYSVRSFMDVYKYLTIKQKYSTFLYSSREYFLRAFEPFLKKELKKYSYKGKGVCVEREDLSQEGCIILLNLFDKSKYRTSNPAKFIAYITFTFPLLLLQKYLKMKKKGIVECSYNDFTEIEESFVGNKVDFFTERVMEAAAHLLSDLSFTIFSLYYNKEFKTADIVALLGVRRSYVTNSLYYARQEIKEYFKSKE